MKPLFYTANVALRFLFEVFNALTLIVLGLTRFHSPLNLLFGLLIPAICLAIWVTFIAPKARVKLPVAARFLIELVIFVVASSYLLRVVAATWAAIYLILVLANSVIVKIGDKQ